MNKPNVIIIQTDQQKASSLDIYNKEINFVKTKNISELAANGVVFENAYCPYPLCVPSRISMLCGQYPSTTGFIANEPWRIAGARHTLFDHLKKSGYHTMLVGKDHAFNFPGTGATTEERWKPSPGMLSVFDDIYTAWHGKFHSPDTHRDCPELEPFIREHKNLDHLWGAEVADWDTERTQTAAISNAFVSLTEKHISKSDKPFVCWLSYPDPHEPYVASKDMYELMKDEKIGLYPNDDTDFSDRAEYMQFFKWFFNAGGPIPESMKLHLLKVYLATVKNVDHQLGKVFDFLKNKDLWENTIIVYCSDHGDFTGEHGLLQKFNCTYNGSAKVPFILSWPGKCKGNIRNSTPVNLVDLPATLCPLLGLEPLEGDQGKDLSPALFGNEITDKKYTVIESGVPGKGLSKKDIANFTTHKYNVVPKGRNPYDPPHRFTGRTYAVVSEKYKLITREGQANELYDMVNDPWEKFNLAQDPEMFKTIEQHLLYLTEHLTKLFILPKGTKIANQDDLYAAGGDKTWEECVAHL